MESGEKDYITKKDVIDMPSALNNQVNLCDSCTYTYPECPSEKDDVIFGNGIGNDNICACNKYQPTIQSVATDINVGDKISKFIDGLEEIFADLRERHVDDSVCGLCEYDGAYMGQSGDWCNECPGFEKDDCFKLSDKTRREWTDEILKALPSAQSQERTEKRMETHACDLISRKEAVDAASSLCDDCDSGYCGSCRVNYPGEKDVIKVLKDLPPVQPEVDARNLICTIEKGITATNSNDIYSLGMRNGMRWCKSLLDNKEPEYEEAPSAQPGQRNAIVFQGIVVEYPSISTYPEYEGKPYFSIKYVEDGQEYIGYGTYKPEVLSEYLKEYFIHSAQPEYRLDEWCHDCKEYDQEHHCCPRFNRVIRESLKDAQPEREEGHWIDGRCNKCGGHAPFWAMASTYYKSDFCPHCGAKMQGERQK